MTPVSRTSWRHSTTSPVVSDPKPFPTLDVQWGGPGARVLTALHPSDAHWRFPGIWLGSSCPTLPGILGASLSFALCSQAASARADLAMTAVTGMVLSLSLRPEPCPSPQRISATSSSSSLAGAASRFGSLSSLKGQSESVLPGLGSLCGAGV